MNLIKLKMRKYLKCGIISLLILFLLHIGLVFFFGGVNYKGTFLTKYEDKGDFKKITTQHFEIVLPKGWFHVFGGYGFEGDAFGTFLNKSGRFEYEYGIFANPFNIDSIFVFSRDSVIANRFTIYIGKNDNNESGIYIPRQHEMELPFSVFMSQGCTNNMNTIIEGIKQMEFKKIHNFEWVEMDSLELDNW